MPSSTAIRNDKTDTAPSQKKRYGRHPSSFIDFITIVHSAIRNFGRYLKNIKNCPHPFRIVVTFTHHCPSTVHLLHMPMHSDTRLFRYCIASALILCPGQLFLFETLDAMPRFTCGYRYSRNMRSDCITHIRKARDAKLGHLRSMRSTLQYNLLPVLVTNAIFFETAQLSRTLKVVREKYNYSRCS